MFQTDEDIYFEAVNVPPANTDYCRNDILDLFYNELDFFSDHTNKFVHGDFNAHTTEFAKKTKTTKTITDKGILKKLSPMCIYVC